MGAYRKLLLHNEVVSGKGANCLNDVTKVLYVSSKKNNTSMSTNKTELEMLANVDFENQLEYGDSMENMLMDNNEILFMQHSVAYVASTVEEKALRKLGQKGRKRCLACMRVFIENELTDDSFIQFKSEHSNILPPCRSTIELICYVDHLLERYEKQRFHLTQCLFILCKV